RVMNPDRSPRIARDHHRLAVALAKRHRCDVLRIARGELQALLTIFRLPKANHSFRVTGDDHRLTIDLPHAYRPNRLVETLARLTSKLGVSNIPTPHRPSCTP